MNKNKLFFLCQLVKDRKFIFLRFFNEDFDKPLSINKIQHELLTPYYKDGWVLIDIEPLTSIDKAYK